MPRKQYELYRYEAVLSLARERGFDLFLDIENDDEVYNHYMDGTVNDDKKLLEQLLSDVLEPADE